MTRNRLTFLLLLGCAALSGCSHPLKPGDVAITIASSAPAFRAGETINISVVVINLGDKTVDVKGNTCPRPFEVIGNNGDLVPPSDEICLASLEIHQLRPGESTTLQFTWTGERVTFTQSIGTTQRQPLPPGAYHMRGRVIVSGLGVLTGGNASVFIMP